MDSKFFDWGSSWVNLWQKYRSTGKKPADQCHEFLSEKFPYTFSTDCSNFINPYNKIVDHEDQLQGKWSVYIHSSRYYFFFEEEEDQLLAILILNEQKKK